MTRRRSAEMWRELTHGHRLCERMLKDNFMHTTHPNSQRIISIIHRLASVTVTKCPARHGYLEIK